jgi:hypothetical protein
MNLTFPRVLAGATAAVADWNTLHADLAAAMIAWEDVRREGLDRQCIERNAITRHIDGVIQDTATTKAHSATWAEPELGGSPTRTDPPGASAGLVRVRAAIAVEPNHLAGGSFVPGITSGGYIDVRIVRSRLGVVAALGAPVRMGTGKMGLPSNMTSCPTHGSMVLECWDTAPDDDVDFYALQTRQSGAVRITSVVLGAREFRRTYAA